MPVAATNSESGKKRVKLSVYLSDCGGECSKRSWVLCTPLQSYRTPEMVHTAAGQEWQGNAQDVAEESGIWRIVQVGGTEKTIVHSAYPEARGQDNYGRCK